VVDSGIDVLCVTDHNTIAGAQRLVDALSCRVVVGEEVRTGRGELIGLFLTERVAMGLGAAETAQAIREQGGLVYVPHPFDPMRHALAADALSELVEAGLVDAIEVFNAKTSLQHLNERAAQFARDHDLPAGAGSDAHVPAALGSAYVEMDDFTDAASFLSSLRGGVVTGRFCDPARAWSPRVLPRV
jgi:predicted metal-dependent phosphoesterase TrpH